MPLNLDTLQQNADWLKRGTGSDKAAKGGPGSDALLNADGIQTPEGALPSKDDKGTGSPPCSDHVDRRFGKVWRSAMSTNNASEPGDPERRGGEVPDLSEEEERLLDRVWDEIRREENAKLSDRFGDTGERFADLIEEIDDDGKPVD